MQVKVKGSVNNTSASQRQWLLCFENMQTFIMSEWWPPKFVKRSLFPTIKDVDALMDDMRTFLVAGMNLDPQRNVDLYGSDSDVPSAGAIATPPQLLSYLCPVCLVPLPRRKDMIQRHLPPLMDFPRSCATTSTWKKRTPGHPCHIQATVMCL